MELPVGPFAVLGANAPSYFCFGDLALPAGGGGLICCNQYVITNMSESDNASDRVNLVLARLGRGWGNQGPVDGSLGGKKKKN